MLVPLTRQKFEQLIPIIATGSQYKYYWGKFTDFLNRFLISVVGVLVLFLIHGFFLGYESLFVLVGIVIGLYWLWGPVFWASLRNLECRRYKYSGFWRGEVIDLFVTEEVVGKEQTVNKRGELVIVENREKRLNLEVGDETGFSTQLQVPLRRAYKEIVLGESAEMVLMSNRPDLSRIAQVSDIYLPNLDLWVSDYPYLKRDDFIEVERQLAQASGRERGRTKKGKRSRKPSRQQEE